MFDDVYIDTNSDEILDYAKKMGFNLIHRKPRLTKTANGNDLLIYHSELYPNYDYYFQLFATAPYIRDKYNRECYTKLISK